MPILLHESDIEMLLINMPLEERNKAAEIVKILDNTYGTDIFEICILNTPKGIYFRVF